MDTRPPMYLACPERGLKLAIGRPRYDGANRITGFSTSSDRPAGSPTRRVLFQALSKLLADNPASGMSLHESGSAGLGRLREIGGKVEERGVPFVDYLREQPVEWITYYGKLHTGFTRNNPSGVIRRREMSGGLGTEDEAFKRILRWERDHYLIGYTFGHDDIDHVEISEGEALRFVLRLLYSRLPFVTAG